MRVGIASDHTGIEVKQALIEFLEQLGYQVVNYGTDSKTSVDYPIYAFEIGEAVLNREIDRGILICRTGIGMCIAGNKVPGIRCAKADNEEEANYTRLDNDSQVLALSALTNLDLLKSIAKVFLETEFSNEERHMRRVKLIQDYENER